MKRSISRAEKCGHSQQELHVLPPSMVYFYCGKCNKKTFVENPTDDAVDNDKPPATLEIDLDGEPLEDEEMLLKEEEEKPENDTWMYYHQDCRVMFTDYHCRDHMEAVTNLGGRLSPATARGGNARENFPTGVCIYFYINIYIRI